MTFAEAYQAFIHEQPVKECGFRLLYRAKQPDGFFAELGGYVVTFENGYKLMFCGQSLGDTAVQEAMIVDVADIVIARDTEDLRWPAGMDPYGG